MPVNTKPKFNVTGSEITVVPKVRFTVPVYVPPFVNCDKPATATVSVPPALPDVGVTDSQLPLPPVDVAAAVHAVGVNPAGIVRVADCDVGSVLLPAVPVNVREVGDNDGWGAVIVNETGVANGLITLAIRTTPL